MLNALSLSLTDASTFANHEVEVFSDVIALRSHNSLSLPEDGRYRLSLTDCHGYIGGGPISAASEGGLEHETFGASKLSFVALPESLEFDVNGQVRDTRWKPTARRNNFPLESFFPDSAFMSRT